MGMRDAFLCCLGSLRVRHLQNQVGGSDKEMMVGRVLMEICVSQSSITARIPVTIFVSGLM